jgi:aquaporin Z
MPISFFSQGVVAKGYAHLAGGYPLAAALTAEIGLAFFFLLITTDSRAPAGFAPLAIGIALALIHLISIPVTNTSANPPRSTGQALRVGATTGVGAAEQRRTCDHELSKVVG